MFSFLVFPLASLLAKTFFSAMGTRVTYRMKSVAPEL